jgi:hypothetical protein
MDGWTDVWLVGCGWLRLIAVGWFGWLVGWLVWLVGLVGWLVWLGGCLVGWLLGCGWMDGGMDGR